MMFSTTRLAFLFAILGMASAMCPGSPPCAGHGSCGAWDTCTCLRNWQGNDCSERICPFTKAWSDIKDSTVTNREEHYYLECGGKGKCDRSSGKCECYDSFTGKGCRRMDCPNKCNGHGTCETMANANSGYSGWDADKIQVCSCDPGFEGNACASRICPTGDDPMTLMTSDGTTLQEYQVQTITITHGGSLAGTFRLSYTDFRGETWYSNPLDVAAMTALTIQEALVSLPNQAIPSVVVALSSGTVTTSPWIFTVTFSDAMTSGDQGLLGVDSTACIVEGCQPYMAGLTGLTTFIMTASTTGTTEEETCSSRGSCDASTGICKCHKGYYGEACQVQTIMV